MGKYLTVYINHPNTLDYVLINGVLPHGGASHRLIRALEKKSGRNRWTACEEKLKSKPVFLLEPKVFNC
jgi:hypothetical protein